MKLALVLQRELIGSNLEVIEAANKNIVGIKGRIIDETKNTLLISNGKTRRIMKNNAVFRIKLNGKLYEVTGSLLSGRPEDRLKKEVRI